MQFLIDSNQLIFQLFLHHLCDLQIKSQSANMTSDLISALALLRVEKVNSEGRAVFPTGAESQKGCYLSLLDESVTLSFYTNLRKFDLYGT